MKHNRAHSWENLIALLSLLCLLAGHVDAQTKGPDNAHLSLIHERIQTIMRQTIERGETKNMLDGRQFISQTFIPPSQSDIDEVKSYGADAVPILAEYLRRPTGFEKYHAIRLLGAIGGKIVVAPLRQVALNDSSAGYREYALAALTQTPWEIAAPILRQAANSDSDLNVRHRATELLNGYAPR